MIDSTWGQQEVADFGGEWSLVDQDDLPPDRSLKCLNCSFVPGSVFTRNGFAVSLSPNDIVNSMFHWLYGDASTSAKSYLVWHKAGYGVREADLATGTPVNLYPVTGAAGAVFAPAGARFYAAHYNTSGVGVDGGKVYANGVGADSLFVRPMLTSEVTVAASAPFAGGQCTIGTRNVAFIMTSRNGYIGRPAPANASLTVVPTSVTTTETENQFLVTVTPTTVWPSWAGSIQLIMTTTTDLATYYFVPLAILATPPGGGVAVSYIINISDADLVADAGFSDATQYFFLLSQDAGGNAPFNPSAVFNAGNRMGYVFRNSNYGQGVFISNSNKYQEINASKNLLYLPGQLEVTTCFYKDKTIWLVGPNWTYAVGDTGDFPVNWAAPDCVDSSIGTLCPEGVSFDMARGIGWVAHTTGLWRFSGGRYDNMPVSYYNNPTWNKINWEAASYCLRVCDSAAIKTVFVAAPLIASGKVNTVGIAVAWTSSGDPQFDDEFCPAWIAGQAIIINGVNYTIASVTSRTALTLNTSAGIQSSVSYSVTPTYNTHLLTWNYTKGDRYDSVKFSLWFLKDFAPSAICVVQNYSGKLQSLWVGKASAGDVYRLKQDNSSTRYIDGANPIDSFYRTGLFGDDGKGGTFQHHGADFRVKGVGTLAITAATMDGAQNAALAPITLSKVPGKEIFRGMKLISERAYYGISNGNIVDAFFSLSLLRHYVSPYTRIR